MGRSWSVGVKPTGRDGHFGADVREEDEYAAGHVVVAVNVPMSRSSFGTRAGFAIPQNGRLLWMPWPAGAGRACRREAPCRGLRSWRATSKAPKATETLEPVDIDELERLVAEGTVAVIDVREPDQRDAGYIPGSRNIPYRVIGDFADDLVGAPHRDHL